MNYRKTIKIKGPRMKMGMSHMKGQGKEGDSMKIATGEGQS